jgi:hypothetical protein
VQVVLGADASSAAQVVLGARLCRWLALRKPIYKLQMAVRLRGAHIRTKKGEWRSVTAGAARFDASVVARTPGLCRPCGAAGQLFCNDDCGRIFDVRADVSVCMHSGSQRPGSFLGRSQASMGAEEYERL